MRRPITLGLLMVFLAVQLYFAKQPIAHQVGGNTWIEVAATPGALVSRAGRYYLVGRNRYYRLTATSTHINATPAPLSWEEVMQPSGKGVWQVAATSSGVALMGTGGPVYPSPQGNAVLWQDPGSGTLYLSRGGQISLTPMTLPISNVKQVLWAPDGNATALLGKGSRGTGLYTLDGDGNLLPSIIPHTGTIETFGFTRKETLLAEMNNGQFVWQGHTAALEIPALQNVTIANGQAALWGTTADSTVLWVNGQTHIRPLPAVHWQGKARFSPDGTEMAQLGTDDNGKTVCYLDGEHSQMTINLPFPAKTQVHLLGFMGSHWVLVTAVSGSHSGTYAWWVNGL